MGTASSSLARALRRRIWQLSWKVLVGAEKSQYFSRGARLTDGGYAPTLRLRLLDSLRSARPRMRRSGRILSIPREQLRSRRSNRAAARFGSTMSQAGFVVPCCLGTTLLRVSIAFLLTEGTNVGVV